MAFSNVSLFVSVIFFIIIEFDDGIKFSATEPATTRPPTTRTPPLHTPPPSPPLAPLNSSSGKWDDPSSLCQLTDQGHYADTAHIQGFIDTLKTIVPPPDQFDPDYRTPCWHTYMHMSPNVQKMLYSTAHKKKAMTTREALSVINSVTHHTPNKSLVCLPKVYFIGFPRSGSTQLYNMLIRHPHITGGLNKEPHWWTKKINFTSTYPHNVLNVYQYLAYYQQAVRHKETLLMDASQSTIWYTLISGNPCLLPQLIPALVPGAKFIVLMRDPTERLYSDFKYLCEEKWRRSGGGVLNESKQFRANGTKIFHQKVQEEMREMENCLKTSSLEECTHHRERHSQQGSLSCGRVRLGVSIYHVHIKRWLREVPRKQFLFLSTDHLASKPLQVLREVWHFLGVAEQGVAELGGVLHEHLHSSHVQESGRTGMEEDTEQMLRRFFKPHNDALAQLLDTDRFRWRP